MNNFTQWSKDEIRNHIRIMKLLDLGQFYVQNNEIRESMKCNTEVLKLDPSNRIALIAMAGLFKTIGDMNQSNKYLERYHYVKANPIKESISMDSKKEFESFIDKLKNGQNVIERTKNREVYKKICGETYGILDILMDSISFIGKSFQDKNSGTKPVDLKD